MYPLTDHVIGLVTQHEKYNGSQASKILNFVRAELPKRAHIEHLLSHLGDMIALAERAHDTCYQIGAERIKKNVIQTLHHEILGHIRDVLRWGFRPAREDTAADASEVQVGERGKPIVSVDDHRRFVKALYRVSRAG